MNIFTYYIMSQRIDMRLFNQQHHKRHITSNLAIRTPINVPTNAIPRVQPQYPSLNRTTINGNMNGVFAARGRRCG
jgi:hypothetical protein